MRDNFEDCKTTFDEKPKMNAELRIMAELYTWYINPCRLAQNFLCKRKKIIPAHRGTPMTGTFFSYKHPLRVNLQYNGEHIS